MSGASMSEDRLQSLREAISEVDARLLELLNRRAELSLAVGSAKHDSDNVVFRPGREAEMLRALQEANPGPLPEDHLRSIYREILSSSRNLQQPQQVAFLGPEGTFSHMAGIQLMGSLATFRPQADLEKVFRSVEEGDCDLGVVPLENSLQGSVGQSFDLFSRYNLFIRAEIFCRIRHSLLSPEEDLSSIKTVYSHPQPLAQCAAWLRANLPRASVVPVESTASAAHRAAGEAGSAAIAHAALADLLPLQVLAVGIEDQPNNHTRFVIIGRTPADRPGTDKTSILFSLSDKPGTLAAVLVSLSRARINLRKLESRPLPGESWKYIFFADLECDLLDEQYETVLKEISDQCHFIRILGSYPSGRGAG